MSKFMRLPSRAEVEALEDDWVTDMTLAHTHYSFQRNSHPLMGVFEGIQAARAAQGAFPNGSQ